MWQKYQLPPPVDTSVDSPDCFLRMFSCMELKLATTNFRSKLGSGGFDCVFKGSLPDGTLVAVKKLEGSRQLDKQFRAEISSLGNIQHANLIRLRGFCAEGSKRLLVYDYMPNGSLNSLLFTSNSKKKRKVLDWKTRFQIALGTARGGRDEAKHGTSGADAGGKDGTSNSADAKLCTRGQTSRPKRDGQLCRFKLRTSLEAKLEYY
ncbi:hypothetical protein SUGI_0543730 [Cryptomeria japonica]|nr:hypothetical protein SUGI_0543730 [Cryptomeria japonica]